MAKTYTPAECALEVGTTAKKFRSFMRSISDTRAGKGNFWQIDQETHDLLIDRWNKKGNGGTTVSFVIPPAKK